MQVAKNSEKLIKGVQLRVKWMALVRLFLKAFTLAGIAGSLIILALQLPKVLRSIFGSEVVCSWLSGKFCAAKWLLIADWTFILCIFAALIFSLLLAIVLAIFWPRSNKLKITASEAAQIIDQKLGTKERVVSLSEITDPDSKQQQQVAGYIESQLAEPIRHTFPAAILPFELTGFDKICISLAFLAWCIVAFLILALKITPNFYKNIDAQELAKLADQTPDLEPQLKEALEKLAKDIELSGLDSQAARQSLEKALVELSNTKDRKIKNTAESEITNAQEKIAFIKPSPTPTPTATSTPPLENKSENKEQNDSGYEAAKQEDQKETQQGEAQNDTQQKIDQQGKQQEQADGQGGGQQGEQQQNQEQQEQGQQQGQGKDKSDQVGKEGTSKDNQAGQAQQQEGQEDQQKQEQQAGNQQNENQSKSEKQPASADKTGDQKQALDQIDKKLEDLQKKSQDQQGQADSKQNQKPGDKKNSQGQSGSDSKDEQKKSEAKDQKSQGSAEKNESQQEPKKSEQNSGNSGDQSKEPSPEQPKKEGDSNKQDGQSSADKKSKVDRDAKMQEAGKDQLGEQGPGLGDKAEFKEAEIKGPDEEKFDERYTGQSTGQTQAKEIIKESKVTLEDLKLSKPDIPKQEGKLEIPLEYEEILR